MSATNKDRLAVGVVSRAHGVRGEARVHLYDPTSESLTGRKTVILVKGDKVEERKVSSVRRAHDAYLLKLDGVVDRDGADALRGWEVALLRSDLPPLEAGEFWLADLIGLRAEDAQGNHLGTVVDIMNTGVQDLAVIHGDDGERMIPIVPEMIVEVLADRVVFDPPEGLPVEPAK